MIRARDVPSLARLGQIEDREYQDPEMWSVLAARQVGALFKKNDAFADEDRCRAKAESNFDLAERICRITNKRLDYFYEHQDRVEPDILAWVEKMQQDIAYLLGDTSEFLGAMPSLIRLTNGATEDRSRRRSFPFLKITGKLKGPRAIVPYLGSLLRSYGVDLTSLVFESVSRNVIALVLKNWETHRTIAKEPTHVLPFQLAVDGWWKHLLHRWGIDLRSQAKNQDYARRGSIDGSIATVDLRMASDVCAYNCVALLIPFDWFKLLCSFRSTSYSAPWGSGEYAKFSSMGNGFTFTLETLIFTAACRAVGSRRPAVYGDDIAIETEYVPSLVKLLRFLGFRTNDAKSFSNPDSRFRESCGCDYYKGVFVTPFYLRECPSDTDRAGWSHVLNGLIACSYPGPMWDLAAADVKRLGLRLVPWNEDTRSGVFITPRRAWRIRKLKIDRRKYILQGRKPKVGPPNLKPNPLYGFSVFDGYAPAQDSRQTAGWRSLFYWYLSKGNDRGGSSPPLSSRFTAYLLQLDERLRRETYGTATVTSSVTVRTRYVHRTRRFDPKPHLTPWHLYLWEDVVDPANR